MSLRLLVKRFDLLTYLRLLIYLGEVFHLCLLAAKAKLLDRYKGCDDPLSWSFRAIVPGGCIALATTHFMTRIAVYDGQAMDNTVLVLSFMVLPSLSFV